MLKLRIAAALLLLCLAQCLAVDFCAMPECKQMRHLGCNNDLTFHKSCLRTHVLVNMQMYRDYLLKIHNKYRDDVAGGRISGLAAARHMPELVWHPKLALIAEYHAKRCLRRLSSYCMAVPHIQKPALNYGLNWLRTSSIPFFRASKNSEKVTAQMEQWLHQVYNLAGEGHSRSDIREIRNILNERNKYVGCAAAEDYDRQSSRFVLVCYYNQRHAWKQSIYEEGAFEVKECPLGRSDDYPNLCRTNTDIEDD